MTPRATDTTAPRTPPPTGATMLPLTALQFGAFLAICAMLATVAVTGAISLSLHLHR